MNNKCKYGILFCSIGLILLILNVVFNAPLKMDSAFYEFISVFLINDFMTGVMKAVTWFGSAGCLIILSIGFVLILKRKKVSIAIIGNLIFVALFNYILKIIFKRPRPIEHRLISESGYSFPSGHSMASMAFYGFLIYLIYKYVENKYLKIGFICLLSCLIVLIGVSRIYLGVHYLSDVLSGFLISLIVLLIYINILQKYANI